MTLDRLRIWLGLSPKRPLEQADYLLLTRRVARFCERLTYRESLVILGSVLTQMLRRLSGTEHGRAFVRDYLALMVKTVGLDEPRPQQPLAVDLFDEKDLEARVWLATIGKPRH